MIKILTGLGAALMIAAVITACSSVHPTTHPVTQAEFEQLVNTTHPRAKLIVGSEDLLGKIVLSQPRFKTVGTLTQAQVYVQNLTEDRYTLEYKFDWEDSQGFTIKGINAWRRFTLTPHQQEALVATGKNPNATNIVVTVRLPDDTFINLNNQLE